MIKAVAWFAAIVVALGLAFFSVTTLLNPPAPPPAHTRSELADARLLKKFAGDLREITDRLSGAPLPPAMLDEARAKLRQTQQSILRARLDSPNYDALLAAADRVSAYANNPTNETLRAAATKTQAELESKIDHDLKSLEQELARTR
jgi:hypothetical protein